VAEFQGPDALDSTLNYPLYYAVVAAFGLPGPQNMSALTDVLSQSKTTYTVGHTLNVKYCGLLNVVMVPRTQWCWFTGLSALTPTDTFNRLGTFLENQVCPLGLMKKKKMTNLGNQDLPRWHSLSVDPQSL
jgi:hypothetical protein